MKNFNSILVLLVLFANPALHAQVTKPVELKDQVLGSGMKHQIVFKRPLVIPFDLFSPKQVAEIEGPNALDRIQFVTFIEGEPVRAENIFENSEAGRNSDYTRALIAAGSSPRADVEERPIVSYCALGIKFTGEKNNLGYVAAIPEPQLPFIKKCSHCGKGEFRMGHQFIEVFIDLKPEERPNPLTARAVSKDLPLFRCWKSLNARHGPQVQDFIRSIGEDNVSVLPYQP